MSNALKRSLLAILTSCFVVSLGAQQPLPPPGERLVSIAPCRLVDTRVSPPNNAAEETGRRFDVGATRCGRFVPSAAKGYSIRITSYDRGIDGKILPQVIAAPAPLSHHTAGLPITFPVPPGSHITIDLEGYYVPSTTPVDPFIEGLPTNGATTAQGAGPSVTPQASSIGARQLPSVQWLHDGTAGEMYLDASRVGDTGVFGISSAAHPWVRMMSGLSDGTDGFGVYNGNYSELMRVSSNGPTRLTQTTWAYLSGRSDYRESATINNNVVNEVKIVNPRDAAGGATNRVTFFDATTDDEVGSPPTTKFQAFTLGYYGQQNISFDSQLHYHWPGAPFYHFRAYSATGGGPYAEPSKETFWVRADTDFDSLHGTRADMYVSGRVGVGNSSPSEKLHVQGGASFSGGGYSTTGNTIVYSDGILGPYLAGNTDSAGNATVTAAGMRVQLGNNGFIVASSPSTAAGAARTFTNRFIVDTSGNVGIGTTGPPTARLYVSTTANADGMTLDGTTNPAITFKNNGQTNAYVGIPTAGGSYFTDAASGDLVIRSQGTNRVLLGQGSGLATVTISGGNVNVTGNITMTGNINAKYQDVAEWVPVAEQMPAGTVVVVSGTALNTVAPSQHAYDTRVAGVVSARPGVILGEASSTKAKIATTGRVIVRVDATKNPIEMGDLLVTGERPGVAMKSEPIDIGGVKIHRPGTIIGKALEPLEKGEGEVLVLLSLQ